MKRQAIGRAFGTRFQLLTAVFVLSLGLGGVALAQHSSGSFTANVTLLDGKLKVSQTSFQPGKLTLVAVNKGKAAHALEIMGTGLKAQRTPTIGIGKTARLTVTIKAGSYHIWDPLKSSMSHATMLTVKGAAASSSSSSSSTSTGSTGTSTGSTGSTGGTGGTGTPMCDHMEVGTDCG